MDPQPLPTTAAPTAPADQPVISLQNVNHWFGGGGERKHALKDITLDTGRGCRGDL